MYMCDKLGSCGNNVDLLCDTIHPDDIAVELLLVASPEERLEIIANNPQKYLDIIQNYNKMPDGREIYLPDLFNFIVSKEPNRPVRIKFKLTDNSPWNEVGYEADSFTDEDVYKAFVEKVYLLLERGTKNMETAADTKSVYKSLIQDTLQPPTESAPAPPVSQGDQYKLSKVDRFLGRTQPVDAGRVDAGRVDAGRVDAGRVDAGRVDAGRVDAGRVDAGRVDANPVEPLKFTEAVPINPLEHTNIDLVSVSTISPRASPLPLGETRVVSVQEPTSKFVEYQAYNIGKIILQDVPVPIISGQPQDLVITFAYRPRV